MWALLIAVMYFLLFDVPITEPLDKLTKAVPILD